MGPSVCCWPALASVLMDPRKPGPEQLGSAFRSRVQESGGVQEEKTSIIGGLPFLRKVQIPLTPLTSGTWSTNMALRMFCCSVSFSGLTEACCPKGCRPVQEEQCQMGECEKMAHQKGLLPNHRSWLPEEFDYLTSWLLHSIRPIYTKDHTWNKVGMASGSHFLKGNFSYSRRPLVLYLWAEGFLRSWPSLFLHSRPILPGWPGSPNMNSWVAVGPPSLALAWQQQCWELGAGRTVGFLGSSSKLMTGWSCTLL